MSTYDADYTKRFYNAYGRHEWDRLEVTAYGRLQAIIHTDFIERYVRVEVTEFLTPDVAQGGSLPLLPG